MIALADADILAILKVDLQVSSTALDTYLNALIAVGQGLYIHRRDNLGRHRKRWWLVEMYAAYLYRRRREENVQMPRCMRWALNNRLFSQKGALNG